MDAMHALLTRRSIRRYTKDPVPDGVIREILEAAMSAPSAGNERPWHFIVITDRKTLDEIPTFHPHTQMLKEAGIAILVCGDIDLERHKGYWVQDCSAASQNLLLAAHAKGLGAVWTGIFPNEDRVRGIRKLLGLPESVIPLSLIPIGYPAEEKPGTEKFDGARVRYNKW